MAMVKSSITLTNSGSVVLVNRSGLVVNPSDAFHAVPMIKFHMGEEQEAIIVMPHLLVTR